MKYTGQEAASAGQLVTFGYHEVPVGALHVPEALNELYAMCRTVVVTMYLQTWEPVMFQVTESVICVVMFLVPVPCLLAVARIFDTSSLDECLQRRKCKVKISDVLQKEVMG